MPQMNLLQAINHALITAMQADDKVFVLGEDVGHFGGVFRATSHLQEQFGAKRCFNTPLVEQCGLESLTGCLDMTLLRILKGISCISIQPLLEP